MSHNLLYPIFLKADKLNILIVGGGNVGLEKLTFLLKSSPDDNCTVLAMDFNEDLVTLARRHAVVLIKDSYTVSYLKDRHIVIVCTDDVAVNIQVYEDCK